MSGLGFLSRNDRTVKGYGRFYSGQAVFVMVLGALSLYSCRQDLAGHLSGCLAYIMSSKRIKANYLRL
jgi:hypothetical protein